MQINEITFDSARPIDSYGPGFFRITDKVLHGPVLITPWSATSWGGFDDTASLLDLAGKVDVLLLGMGTDSALAPADLARALENAGLGVEAMASPAACRTFNVLAGDGRRIALAALPV